MKPMIVMGGRFYNPVTARQTRVIAGVRSRAEYQRVTGLSASEARDYHGETGNPHELAVALTYPGTAWIVEDEYGPEAKTLWREYDATKHVLTGRKVKVTLKAEVV